MSGNPGEGRQVVDDGFEFDPSGGVGGDKSASPEGPEGTVSMARLGAPAPFTDYPHLDPFDSRLTGPDAESETQNAQREANDTPDFDPSGGPERADDARDPSQDTRSQVGHVDAAQEWDPTRFEGGDSASSRFDHGGG